jgi:uncharacterized protein YdcH (DUF465 family)
MTEQDALKEELLRTDDEFRRLYEEHQECERQLTELYQRSFFSEQDEFAEKRLKRHKLTLKDHMAAILREHEASQVPV